MKDNKQNLNNELNDNELEACAGGEAGDWTPEQVNVLKKITSHYGLDANIFMDGKKGTPVNFIRTLGEIQTNVCATQEQWDSFSANVDQIQNALSLKDEDFYK